MAEIPNAQPISEASWSMSGNAASPRSRSNILTVAMSGTVLERLPRHVLDPEAVLAQAEMSDLTRARLAGPDAPDLILSPLVGRGFDAMDLLTILREVSFRGRYLVLAPKVPHVALIRSEMQGQAPDLNVDIIVLDGSSVLHEV